MKQSVSMPVALGIIAVVVIAVGVFLWRVYLAPTQNELNPKSMHGRPTHQAK